MPAWLLQPLATPTHLNPLTGAMGGGQGYGGGCIPLGGVLGEEGAGLGSPAKVLAQLTSNPQHMLPCPGWCGMDAESARQQMQLSQLVHGRARLSRLAWAAAGERGVRRWGGEEEKGQGEKDSKRGSGEGSGAHCGCRRWGRGEEGRDGCR